MKYCLIPILILLSLSSLSFASSRAVEKNMDICLEKLQSALLSSAEENWSDASRAVDDAYRHWQSRQTYLHIVCHRDAINAAESLFRRCQILSHDGDLPEFHANAAELISQLQFLADMESFSIKHVL